MPRRKKQAKKAKKPRKAARSVVYEFANPALDGHFTVELPPGWTGGKKPPRKAKPRRR